MLFWLIDKSGKTRKMIGEKNLSIEIDKYGNAAQPLYVIVDNNEVGEDLMNPVFKQVRGLARTKVQNGIGRQWIANELAKKAR